MSINFEEVIVNMDTSAASTQNFGQSTMNYAAVPRELGSPDTFAADLEVRGILLERNTSGSKFEVSPVPPAYSPISTCQDPLQDGHCSSGESVASDDITALAKKRKLNPAAWKRNARKERINKGLSYVNSNDEEVQPRSMKPPCPNSCMSKCTEKMTEDQRQTIFDNFWGTGCKQQQWGYLANHVVAKKSDVHRENSNRVTTKHYFLSISSSDPAVSPTRIRVCQKFFLATLGISPKMVITALNKYSRSNANVSPDRRGSYERPRAPDTEEMKKLVLKHIKSFPRIPPHYCRKESTKLYLDGSLTVAKMYHLYEDWLPADQKKATERQYRDIFNGLNLHFQVPKKDQCNTCFAYAAVPEKNRTEAAVEAHQKHLQHRDMSRAVKTAAKVTAQTSGHVSAICFDFQKILSAPSNESGMMYYNRKLSIYNFTIFEMGVNIGNCYVWDETVAGRGCNEVGSCLINFMTDKAAEGIKEFHLFSDNCSGQNRNRFVFGAFAVVARKLGVSIIHTFLEAGHTQNEADSVHALIERRKKNVEINLPSQWYSLMRVAKSTGHPYVVKEVSQPDILDLKPFVFKTQWEKDTKNKKIKWSQVKQIKVDAGSSNIIRFRDNLSDEFREVVLYPMEPAPTRNRKSKTFVFTGDLHTADHCRFVQKSMQISKTCADLESFLKSITIFTWG